jgi:hypothetical protein
VVRINRVWFISGQTTYLKGPETAKTGADLYIEAAQHTEQRKFRTDPKGWDKT